jgi:oxygen-independent coproporphyrinogen-3 oxidase
VAPERDFGVYVHVPFCRARCDYCAFATYVDRDHLMDRYAAACIRELQQRRDDGEVTAATSVFFGGGTPSRLPTDALGAVLDAIPRAAGAEVTVECNPEDATPDRLAAYRAAGVTRLSFGVQSTHDHVLEGLGRRSVPDAAERVTEAAAEARLATCNVDLIFGAPAESDDDWRATLDAVLSLPHPPPHVSAYALTVEPGTPLALDARRHPDEDRLARRYEIAERTLTDAGYAWEEISNWARPGHECRHNGLYWAQGDYAGIGSAAHSHRAGRRWWNVRTPDRYVAAVEEGRPVTGGEEHLDAHQRGFERLALLLRTRHGVPAEALPDPADTPELEGLFDRRADGRAVLTVRGRLLANEVTTHLVVPE